MKRRKNRLVIEFTTSHPLTEKAAVLGLKNLLDFVDLQRAPLWETAPEIYAEKLEVKAFSRVMIKKREEWREELMKEKGDA